MKVNLAKALKLKNVLIGELNRAKEILTRENSRESNSTSTVDRTVVYTEILGKTAQLVALKTAITTANVGLYGFLAEMAEAKAGIAYVKSLNTVDGVVESDVRFGAAPSSKTYSAFFTVQGVDVEVARLQKVIEDFQDKVDDFNATTFIEV